MTLAHDLLDQARHLARRERRKPKQASLRRAISTAYYALFHLLADEASRMIVRGHGPTSARSLVFRAFAHEEMRDASNAFSAPKPQSRVVSIVNGSVPSDLQDVASAFVELHQRRNEADYDISRRFSRAEVIGLMKVVEDAFQKWESVRDSTEGRAYLTALLLWRKRRG